VPRRIRPCLAKKREEEQSSRHRPQRVFRGGWSRDLQSSLIRTMPHDFDAVHTCIRWRHAIQRGTDHPGLDPAEAPSLGTATPLSS
jgi:hypothetical protein